MRETINFVVGNIAVITAAGYVIYSIISGMKGTFYTSNSCKIRIRLAFLISLCYFITIFLAYDNSFVFWGSICNVVVWLSSIVLTFKLKKEIKENGEKEFSPKYSLEDSPEDIIDVEFKEANEE